MRQTNKYQKTVWGRGKLNIDQIGIGEHGIGGGKCGAGIMEIIPAMDGIGEGTGILSQAGRKKADRRKRQEAGRLEV